MAVDLKTTFKKRLDCGKSGHKFKDSVQEIRKLNTFLGTGCEEALLEKIALACSVHNLKKADAEFKENPFMRDKRFDMYRKVHSIHFRHVRR
ncbi:hypothetical protein DPMN_093836 [Dreissena polymorpha]|uniref:Uncharacterized protein n=1 Tax=Dreissena polymorpha TaxID=45954 RepID=A0A9D4R195_DREPO|nr:hypothetical protein DPMN_093836 [Dreissena polymorpha]